MNQNLNNPCTDTHPSGDEWFHDHLDGDKSAVASTEIPIGEEKGNRQIPVMLVGDHAILRHGLKCSLQDYNDINIVGEVTTGEELLKALTTYRPQVVVLDIDLSDAAGHTLIGQIKEVDPSCRVIVLTPHSNVLYASTLLEHSADGFVFENSSFNELLEMIRTLARGKTYISSEYASEWIGGSQSRRKSALGKLSKRELEVLTRVGKGLSLRAVGSQMGISNKTVSTYQTRLMDKLNLYSKTDLVKFALQTGLID